MKELLLASESASAPDIVDERAWTDNGRRKDTFVATLAHELRQPLSAMRAAVEVVGMGPDADSTRQAVAVMRRQLGQMNGLVDDLVEAARWALGKVTLRTSRVDLRDVVDDAVADAAVMVAARGQTVVVERGREPVYVEGDRQRLLQVVSNLVRNAVTYTPPGGQIEIAVARMASTVVLCVGDTGRGIGAEALPHVFDLFSQERPHEGTSLGVGLSIVREIVLLHGGIIEARSGGAGKGSEFLVTFPRASDDDAAVQAALSWDAA